jgi:hypothetical protein
MAETSSGVSQGYVDSQISSLRSEMRSEIHGVRAEIRALQSYVEQEIARLEREMREIGEMIVKAIDRQTTAVVGGVAATTLMIERTKQQIQTDFSETRQKLDLQTESTMQIEIGKKVAEAQSNKTKLENFVQDIKTRFEKSIESAAINRELYDLNFQKILDEFDNKIQTIGSHIFQIRHEDIAPAERAAQIAYQAAHNLPIEMDLHRLDIRSQNLDQSLSMLKSSRLDEVLHSQARNDAQLQAFAGNFPAQAPQELVIEAIYTSSPLQQKLLAGLSAQPCGTSAVDLQPLSAELQALSAAPTVQTVARNIPVAQAKVASSAEVVEMAKAARVLRSKGLISEDAATMFEDFIGSGQLKIVEVPHAH